MATFLGLPLELRQKILGYAFEDALAADVRINLWLRINLRTMIYVAPLELIHLVDSGPSPYIKGHPIDRESTLYAPTINDFASNLQQVHPRLASDMLYVLGKSLKGFEERYETESAELWQKWWTVNRAVKGTINPIWLVENVCWADPWSGSYSYHRNTSTGTSRTHSRNRWVKRAF
jgi:hypothetical protein